MENNINKFIQGYMCAVATMVNFHGGEPDTLTENLFQCNACTLEELKKAGVDKQDIEVLKPLAIAHEKRIKELKA